jgi:hypothetical protein
MTDHDDSYSEPDQARTFQSIVNELSWVENGIQRAQSSIYTSFGLVLPGSFTVFGWISSKNTWENPVPAVILLILISATIMWACCLWMELLRYYRYKYVRLMPEFYEVSSRTTKKNMMVFQAGQSKRSWLPALLLNLSVFIFLIGILIASFAQSSLIGAFYWIGVIFIIFAVVVFCSVLVELYDVQQAACRAYNSQRNL